MQRALGRPHPTIGVATGGTPVATYEELIRRHHDDGLRLDHAHYVLLDEYVGLAAGHPQSYRRYIRDVFTDPVGVPDANVHGPAGDADDLRRAADDYEALLAALPPREIQILGIGRDGHIGFNEPLSSLASRTRIKTLHPKTRTDNERFFDDGVAVPVHAITMVSARSRRPGSCSCSPPAMPRPMPSPPPWRVRSARRCRRRPCSCTRTPR